MRRPARRGAASVEKDVTNGARIIVGLATNSPHRLVTELSPANSLRVPSAFQRPPSVMVNQAAALLGSAA